MAAEPEAVEQLVYTPERVARYTTDRVQDRKDWQHLLLKTGIPTMDKYLHGLMPGELMVVLANTSQYKTGFMQFMARQVCRQLLSWPVDGRKPIVVYVSWENLVEQLGYYDIMSLCGLDSEAAWYGKLTDDEFRSLDKAAQERSKQDLWIVGRSLSRPCSIEMNLGNVEQAIKLASVKYRVAPAMIFLDYLQEIPGQGGDMRERVMNNIGRAKAMGLALGCPIVIAAQAGRDVLSRDWKMPQLADAMESARIEQAADKVIGLWYPCKTEGVKGTLPRIGHLPVTENVLIASILKNRFGSTLPVLVLDVDPKRNVIRPANIKSQELTY